MSLYKLATTPLSLSLPVWAISVCPTRTKLSPSTCVTNHLSAFVLAQVRWVDAADMGGCGITTGMKKVLALASKARSGGAGPSAAIKRKVDTKTGAAEKTKKRKDKEDPAEGRKKGLQRADVKPLTRGER